MSDTKNQPPKPETAGSTAAPSLCLWCRKPGGSSIVKHPKTAGVPKGKYHAACLIKARKAKANDKIMPTCAAVDLSRLVRPLWFKGDDACDWHEDSGHENGSYYCKCPDCKADFLGHKRRHICRKCHYEAKARYDALTTEERAAFDEKRNAESRSFFDWPNDQAHL